MRVEFLKHVESVLRGNGEQEHFLGLIRDHQSYCDSSANAGPHSFHGKFYRRKAAELERKAGEVVGGVMERSGKFEYGFGDLYKRCRERFGIWFQPMDLIISIIQSGMNQSRDKASFDDIIVKGVRENIGPKKM